MILNKNENPKKIIFEDNLEKGIYLITQKRYGGKALDIALIKVSDYDSEIVGIQISINKKGIFTKEEVQMFLFQLQTNIYYYYNLEVKDENLYFCYIFDYNNQVQDMLKGCKKNRMKYFFFDITNDCFKDEKGNIINKIKQNSFRLKPFPYKKITDYFKNKEIINISKSSEQSHVNNNDSKGSKILINDAQKNTIIKLFKMNLGQEEVDPEGVELDIQYQNTQANINVNYLRNNNEFCVAEYVDKEYTGSIAMITYLIKVNLIKSDGQIFAHNNMLKDKFDYYKVIQKECVNNK